MNLSSFDLQHAPCGVFTFGEDLVLLAVNQTLADILGVAPADLTGKSLDHLLTPSNRLMFHMQVLTMLYMHGHVEEISLHLAGAHGGEIPVLFNAVCRQRESGTVTECVVVQMNQRKRLEDELFKIKKATEQIPGAVFQYLQRADGTSCFPYASEGIRAIYGLSPLQVQQSADQVFKRIHPDDLARVTSGVKASAQALHPWHQIYRVNLPLHGIRWLEGNAMPESRSDGGVIWHGYVSDVTDRKLLEVALASEHERTLVTLRSIGDAVITTNAVGQVEYLNPIAERLTGWSQSEAVGQSMARVFNIVHQDTRSPVENPVARCLAERTIVGLARDAVLIAKGGKECAVEDSAAPIFSGDGSITGVVMVFRDVTDQRKLRQEVEHRAAHDHLTGLPNRAEFDRILKQMFESALTTGAGHALCYIDLDRFKIVNDSCGHAAGDLLLRQVSALLLKCVRAKDTVARLGGDEFALILENCDLETAQRIAKNVCDRVAELHFQHSGKSFRVGASIGVALLDRRWDSASLAQQAADGACFAAKKAGRGRVHVYEDLDTAILAQHDQMQWATRIQQAIETDRFELFVQAIKALGDGALAGRHFEVLLGLRENTGNLIFSDAIIPVAQRYGLATQIDRWVVTHACAWMVAQQGAIDCVHTIVINLSGQSVGDRDFHRFVCKLLDRGQVSPKKWCFQITETAVTEHLDDALVFFDMLHQRGARIALDNFGGGMSSMACVKRLPVDYLKIDGQIVKNMATDVVDCAMVRSINEIAHLTGKRTIAERVESESILGLLRELGVDFAQGCHIGTPVRIEDALA
ncbi:MAG: EAL domain-containing protein [Glaciimonas sp.]|nr:EAL domain-containing protein [Glaciimonas sp.]